ncbi:response regulator transcription factor [Kordia sp.]|uniref:response regulator transcription factor n=1 Tax=Kordia sp. TaxID=1965332 RepID=UPI003D6B5DBE
MITIAIAEDHQALIDGIHSFLEYEDDIKLVGEANDGEELLAIVKKKQPTLVLCDIRMPKMDGITATKAICKSFPNTKVIAFTMFEQQDAVKQMIDAGASGYVLKNSSLKTVLEAIRFVAEGKKYFDKKLHYLLDEKSSKNSSKSLLSKREKQILILISKGKTSYEIAIELFIGKTTVDTHRKNMIKKLGLKGSGELLRYALEQKYNFE